MTKLPGKQGVAASLDWTDFLQDFLIQELQECYGDDVKASTLTVTLLNTVRKTGRQFFWICDEWDLLFREEVKDQNAPARYLELLRTLFKGSDGFTGRVFAGAWLTGIMPMIRINSQSAVSDFVNYTMFTPGPLSPFTGFTRAEVRQLCKENAISYEEMASWYEGYSLPRTGPVYNPQSVMLAIKMGVFLSYWSQSSSNEVLRSMISLDEPFQRETVRKLLAGESVPVRDGGFNNDLENIESPQQALTAMVHLGYLTWDAATRTGRIPNREVREEFWAMVEDSRYPELLEGLPRV